MRVCASERVMRRHMHLFLAFVFRNMELGENARAVSGLSKFFSLVFLSETVLTRTKYNSPLAPDVLTLFELPTFMKLLGIPK